MPPRIPKTLRVHGLDFDVWTLGDGRLAFDYADGGTRRVVKRRGLDALRAEAERIALNLVNANTAAKDMSADEHRIYVAARTALAPFNLPVDLAARELAEAFAIIGKRVSIQELARFWVARNPSLSAAPPTADIVAELIATLGEKGRSGKYLSGLRSDLARFAAAHATIGAVDEITLAAYLRTIKDRKGGAVGPRRRDNVRDAIVRLFAFARDRHWLPQDRKTAASKIERINEGGEVTTFTPDQLALLIEHVSHRWRPWMALGAFAGLRTSEIFRLDWSAVKWEQRVIAVSSKVAKKVRVSRMVPMSDNLIAWLAPWRDTFGPIYQVRTRGQIESAHRRELKKLRKATGIEWDNNALRHSFGSYRLALVKNIAQVALEMGNSPEKVRENYHDPKPEDEARKYFAIQSPESVDNVLPLALEFHR